MGIVKSAGDLLYTFRFIRMMVMKWENWDAYKQGVIDEKGNWVLSYKFTLDQTPGIEYDAMLYIPLDILKHFKKQYEEKIISKQEFIKLIEKMISKGQARFQFDKWDGKKRTKIK